MYLQKLNDKLSGFTNCPKTLDTNSCKFNSCRQDVADEAGLHNKTLRLLKIIV